MFFLYSYHGNKSDSIGAPQLILAQRVPMWAHANAEGVVEYNQRKAIVNLENYCQGVRETLLVSKSTWQKGEG